MLMFSNVEHPAVTVYPDSDKIGVWTGNHDDDVMVRRSSPVDYFAGEPRSWTSADERRGGLPSSRQSLLGISTTRATRSG